MSKVLGEDVCDRRSAGYAAFKMRQVPQMKIVGSNYPLVTRTAVLDPGEALAAIPDEPTHVVIAQTPVRALPRGSYTIVELKPGTQVTLIETADGRTLVAKNGHKLKYMSGKQHWRDYSD